jgi:hypothetical protein
MGDQEWVNPEEEELVEASELLAQRAGQLPPGSAVTTASSSLTIATTFSSTTTTKAYTLTALPSSPTISISHPLHASHLDAAGSGDNTGNTTWSCTESFLSYLLTATFSNDPRTSIELGSGCNALPSQVLSLRFPAMAVIATEHDPATLALLRSNIAANSSAVVAQQLTIGTTPVTSPAVCNTVPAHDLVIGSEVVYDSIPPRDLAATLSALSNPNTLVLIAGHVDGRLSHNSSNDNETGWSAFDAKMDAAGFEITLRNISDEFVVREFRRNDSPC